MEEEDGEEEEEEKHPRTISRGVRAHVARTPKEHQHEMFQSAQ